MHPQDINLYRDDRLMDLKNKCEPESEQIKKSIQSISRERFENNHLCNFKIADYLDVTLPILLIVHSIKQIMK